MIRADLRGLAELYLVDDLAWWRERYPGVWPRPMAQMELFK